MCEHISIVLFYSDGRLRGYLLSLTKHNKTIHTNQPQD